MSFDDENVWLRAHWMDQGFAFQTLVSESIYARLNRFLITQSRHLLARSLIKARYSTGSLVSCFLVVGFYVCLIILGYYLFILRNLLVRFCDK